MRVIVRADMRTTSEIINEMNQVAKLRHSHNNLYNEGFRDGFNPHEDRLTELRNELFEAQKAESPLTKDLDGERAWFNAQKFTAKDVAKARAACLARGYSLADLQAAAKAAK